jgi:MoxR-like ATPase
VTAVADRHAMAAALEDIGYLTDDGLATALFLAASMRQPLLLEGEPGVGKTTAAKALARVTGGPLLRLQCYEGITASEALYEWNYARQLLEIRLAESGGSAVSAGDLFCDDYLLERPLLAALRHPGPEPAVLLIDEIDRADDEFEALLFEFLGERSVTIPELGTVRSVVDPIVVLTSNRSRELHDALKRRCLYHWIAFPDVERAAAIVRRNVAAASEGLVTAATAFVTAARDLDLDKPPGIAEAIDWVGALHALGVTNLDLDSTRLTLGAVVKSPDDLDRTVAALDSGELVP